ncbi:MAG: transposase [Oscillospiraceae bacterium]|nr:transposase [Oscillospiraceae bacterium]
MYWGDETGVSNRENFERGFAEKGKPPVVPLPTKKERANMISAITNQGHARFMVYPPQAACQQTGSGDRIEVRQDHQGRY